MIPGMNPRAMRQAMKRLGIQQQDIEATEVIIKTADKEILIKNPQVAKVNMMGQETFQIVGNIEERPLEKEQKIKDFPTSESGDSEEPEISEEDIKTVMEQTGADENRAKQAIQDNNGDLAAAIIELKSS